jgi:hypothetical protein
MDLFHSVPDRCTRCPHVDGVHRSVVIYPRTWDRQSQRPCIMTNCGCQDFVPRIPFSMWFLGFVARPVVRLVWIVYLVVVIFAGVVHASASVYVPLLALGVVGTLLWVHAMLMLVRDSRRAAR